MPYSQVVDRLGVQSPPKPAWCFYADGAQASLILSDLPYPAGARIPSEFFEGDSFSGHVYMKTVILPLADFSGIDLSKITEISLNFDQSDSGELFIADFVLVP